MYIKNNKRGYTVKNKQNSLSEVHRLATDASIVTQIYANKLMLTYAKQKVNTDLTINDQRDILDTDTRSIKYYALIVLVNNKIRSRNVCRETVGRYDGKARLACNHSSNTIARSS